MRNKRSTGAPPPIGPAHAKAGRLLNRLRTHRTPKLAMNRVKSVSPGYLSGLEHGRVTPTWATLKRLVRELGGDAHVFAGLHTAMKHEQATHSEQRRSEARSRDLGPAELGVVYDEKVPVADNPIIEIVDDITNETTEVQPDVTDPNNLDFHGPFIVDDIDEHHYVNADRILWKSIFNRTVRAIGPEGFRVFPFSFGEGPVDALIVKKFQVGVRAPARIERVLQLGKLAYKVALGLPEHVQEGDSFDFSFFKIMDATGYCDTFVGGSGYREMKRARIAVYFEEGFAPSKVFFFEAMTPYSPPGIFSPERELKQKATGQYEKVFTDLAPSLMYGVAWTYDD